MTRGQMAAFLTRTLHLPKGDVVFSDTAGHIFEADIAALASAGVTKGCNPPANDRFCPDEPLTRGQMAAFISRALDLPKGAATFTDTAGHIFEADIAALASAGITKGCNPPANDRFCPDEPLTRGQMAAFLFRTAAEGFTNPAQPLAITSEVLPAGQVGSDYSAALEASGGTPPYTWSADGLPSGLNINQSSGVISGTPKSGSHGSHRVVVSVTDAVGNTTAGVFTLEISPLPLEITKVSLPGGKVGDVYAGRLESSGGVAPYTWTAQGLPAGVSVSDSGKVTGVPAVGAHGDHTARVTVVDSLGTKASAEVTFTVHPADLIVLTSSLPEATVYEAYETALSAAGGVTPYVWSVSGLPDGLSFEPDTGTVSGSPIPGTRGSHVVEVSVKDDVGVTAETTFTLDVIHDLSIVTESLVDAQAGDPYEVALEADGGASPYTWSVSALPEGLSLDTATGEIAGTPTGAAYGEHTIVVSVTDTELTTVDTPLTLFVETDLEVVTMSLPDAWAGAEYSATLEAVGGAAPHTWSASGLPEGLTLDPDTGEIIGIPEVSTEGTHMVEFSVTDSVGATVDGTAELVVNKIAGVTAGGKHSCGLITDGTAYCWGAMGKALGYGGNDPSYTPVQVAGELSFRLLTAGRNHTCGIATDGTGYCWGDFGWPLGLGDPGLQPAAPTTPIAGGHSWAILDASEEHTCGITTDGDAYCWGASLEPVLGTGHTETASPKLVLGGHKWKDITTGTEHTCGVTAEGDAYCWGAGDNYQLGNGASSSKTNPTPVSGDLKFESITAGAAHTCGITTDGDAYCWGTAGPSGYGDDRRRTTPHPVAGGLTFVSLAAGSHHTCGITTDGDAYCWGSNGSGELGAGYTSQREYSPVKVAGDHKFVEISAGTGMHACGATVTGYVYCWGDNQYGALGDGTTTDRKAPVPILTPS